MSDTSTPAALATRAAIVETAERLFRSIGYQKTTVADIARELRMSPANIYRFFPSKAAINEACCSRLLAGLEAAAWQVARSDASPADRVSALFTLLQDQTIVLFFQERRMHDMVAAAMEENWSIIETYIGSLDAAFTQIVRDGLADGSFGGIDAEQAGKLMHASTVMFTHPTLVQQCVELKDLPDLAAAMAAFCLRALRPD